MARKWNTDTFTFCVVKWNMRNHLLSLAIALNILTRQQKKQWYGRWILLWLLSCVAPTCTFKEKVMSSEACFGSFFVSNNGGTGEDRFLFSLTPFRQKPAEAAGCWRDIASWGAPGRVPGVWEWHRWTWWPSGVTQIKTDNRAGRHADRRGSWWASVHADRQSWRQTDRQADVITDRFIFGIARWGYVSWGFKLL